MIKFYGSPASSSGRTRWMLEEVGVPYEYIVVDVRGGEARKAAFREINPFGTVPFLVDGDVRLAESMAINTYLAGQYKPELVPADAVGRALAWQWSLWAITSVQPKALDVMMQMMRPDPERGAKIMDEAKSALSSQLDLLERSMTGEFVLGDKFTVADVNVGSCINLVARLRALPEEPWPKVFAWLARMRERPAYKRAAEG